MKKYILLEKFNTLTERKQIYKKQSYLLMVTLFSKLFIYNICSNIKNILILEVLFITIIYLVAFIRPQPILNRILCKTKKLEVI